MSSSYAFEAVSALSDQDVLSCLQYIMEYLYNGGTWTVHIDSHEQIIEVSNNKSLDYYYITFFCLIYPIRVAFNNTQCS